MKILHLYILRELARVFALMLTVLTSLLVFGGVLREITASGLSAMQGLAIVPYFIPTLMPYTIPVTLLLSVCVVYGRMAGDQEVTAAKAAGINVLSLLWPGFFAGALLSAVTFGIYDQVIPWSVERIQQTMTRNTEEIFLDLLKSNHCLIDPKRGMRITVAGVEGRLLVSPTFEYTARSREYLLTAREATLEFDLENRLIIAHLVDGYVESPDAQRVWFAKDSRPFPLPDDVTKTKERHMSLAGLQRERLARQKVHEKYRERRDGLISVSLATGDFSILKRPDVLFSDLMEKFYQLEIGKLDIEFHQRTALSFGALFFALLGAPFSLLQARREILTNFFLCFTPILLIYYPVVLFAVNVCRLGRADPALMLWSGNLILAAASGPILQRVLRN